MIRIGLIGAGFMGNMHAACYKALEAEGVQLTAVADSRTAQAEALAQKYGARVYTSGMELIQDPKIDAVDICLPTDLHTVHAVAAMRAGKHVFVEKPVCFLEEEMQLMLQTEAETGVKVQVGQLIRFWNEYVWLKKVVDSQVYGKLQSGVFKRLSGRPAWAADNWLSDPARSGSVAVEMHIHDVDYIRYILGEPDRVKSEAFRDENGVIQHILTLFGYGHDVGISVEACWDYPVSYPFNGAFRVKFEKATVEYDHGTLTVYPEDGQPFTPDLPAECQVNADVQGNISSLGSYYNELKYFVEWLNGKHDATIAPVIEGIRSVKLALKEVEAAGGMILK